MVDYMDDSTDADSEDPQEQLEPQAEEEGEQTALIDKNVFPEPPQVGDVCKFRVVAVHDNEVELEYVDEEASGGEGAAGQTETGQSDDDMMG